MFFLIVIFAFLVLFCYFFVKKKIHNFLGEYFGNTNIKEVLKQTELDAQNTPKSISGMDSIYVHQIEEDFPEISISELKRESEKIILDYFSSIQNKDSSKIKNDKIKSIVNHKIEELGERNVSYESIKFHNTVISSYQKKSSVASIMFATNVEYYMIENNEKKKIQDRAKIEFIYVIDSEKVPINIKTLGINCPNCGSPIKSIKEKHCEYCGTTVLDISKRVWSCNDLIWY